MKVYIVFTDAYAIEDGLDDDDWNEKHGFIGSPFEIFATKELANEYIEKVEGDYSNDIQPPMTDTVKNDLNFMDEYQFGERV